MVVNKSMRNEINGIEKYLNLLQFNIYSIFQKTSKSFVLIFFIYLINFSDLYGPESSLIKIRSVLLRLAPCFVRVMKAAEV